MKQDKLKNVRYGFLFGGIGIFALGVIVSSVTGAEPIMAIAGWLGVISLGIWFCLAILHWAVRATVAEISNQTTVASPTPQPSKAEILAAAESAKMAELQAIHDRVKSLNQS